MDNQTAKYELLNAKEIYVEFLKKSRIASLLKSSTEMGLDELN